MPGILPAYTNTTRDLTMDDDEAVVEHDFKRQKLAEGLQIDHSFSKLFVLLKLIIFANICC